MSDINTKLLMIICALVFVGAVVRVVQVSDNLSRAEAKVTELVRAREKDENAMKEFWKLSGNAIEESLQRIEKRALEIVRNEIAIFQTRFNTESDARYDLEKKIRDLQYACQTARLDMHPDVTSRDALPQVHAPSSTAPTATNTPPTTSSQDSALLAQLVAQLSEMRSEMGRYKEALHTLTQSSPNTVKTHDTNAHATTVNADISADTATLSVGGDAPHSHDVGQGGNHDDVIISPHSEGGQESSENGAE